MLFNSKAKFKEIKDDLDADVFTVKTWKSIKGLILTQDALNFLFQEETCGHTRLHKISSLMYKLLEFKEYADIFAEINHYMGGFVFSKYFTDEKKLKVFEEDSFKCFVCKTDTLNHKGFNGNQIFIEARATVAHCLILSDTIFNEALKGNAFDLMHNKRLTPSQFYNLVDAGVRGDSNFTLSPFVLDELKKDKPRYLNFTLDMNWLSVKACRKIVSTNNFYIFLNKIETVDRETFDILEVSWQGTFEDLIEACAFNGPDQ